MLYTGKPWFGYGFIGSNWGFYKSNPCNLQLCDSNSIFKGPRPKTGEEIRFMLNYYLILGAKGFHFDKDCANNVFQQFDQGIAINPLPRVGIDTVLQSDTIGGDWLLDNHPSLI
jgi:hypothetical protein